MLAPVALTIGALRLWTNISILHQLNRLAARLIFPHLPAFASAVDRASGTATDAALAEAEATLLAATVHANVEHRFIPVPPPITVPATTTPCSLHTLIVTARNTPPNTVPSRPLILLHGHGMNAALWSSNFDSFLAAGYDAIYAPDLLGWGRSSRPIFPPSSTPHAAIRFYLDSLIAWLDALSLPPSALAGHSLGGHVAHELALERPSAFTSLLLVSPAALLPKIPFLQGLKYCATPQRILHSGGLLALAAFKAAYPSTVPAYNTPGFRDLVLFTNAVSCASGDAAAACLVHFYVADGAGVSASSPKNKPRPSVHALLTRVYALLRWRWRARCARPLIEQVRPCGIPVEIISGDRDGLVAINAVRKLYRAMRAAGVRVRLSVVHGGDHAPQISASTTFMRAVLRGGVL